MRQRLFIGGGSLFIRQTHPGTPFLILGKTVGVVLINQAQNKYNQELTEANKANIVDKREKEAFDDEYNEFVSSLNSNINENLWENLELETGSGMKTDTFFEVFNTYCGDM